MNNNFIDNASKHLEETYRLMLMTLEYGGSVNLKALDDIEKQLKESNCKTALLNS